MENINASACKIAITGPESTGKSQLSRQLSEHFRVAMVPEYARIYLENKTPDYRYSLEDVLLIARHQIELEDKASQKSDLIFCDTDILVCRVWAEVVFNTCPPWLLNESECRAYQFTLLNNIDLPWEDDPLREHPHRREEIFQRYVSLLEHLQRPYRIVSGTGDERFRNALHYVEEFLNKKG